MNSVVLSTKTFPRFQQRVTGHWAPIYLEPIAGSGERIVVAVATVSANGFHIEQANALERLDCFYGEAAGSVRLALAVTVDHLRAELADRSVQALADYDPPISGAHVGQVRIAEGASLQAIGVAWMGTISSLYDVQRTSLPTGIDVSLSETTAEWAGTIADRLPRMVFDYVSQQAPTLVNYFRADLRGRPRQKRSFDVSIDFASTELAANFGTLQAGKLAPSVRLITKALWDLRVDRDRAALFNRTYEILVQVPRRSDPQFSDLQLSNVSEAVEELEVQANQEELRFQTFTTVEEIGQRVVEYQRL